MTFREDIKILENKIDHFQSVEELRHFLKTKDLKLIVVIVSNKFSCVEWDITEKRVSKILDLGLRIRVSKDSDESLSLETIEYVSVRMEEVSWTNLENLFKTLKKGIKSCIKNIRPLA